MTTYQFLGGSGQLSRDSVTGAVAISNSTVIQRVARLVSVSVKFSVAPTTSENLTVTLNNVEGVAYDVVLLSTDPSSGAVTSIVYLPDSELWLAPGDSIDVAYTNTDTRTYGLQVTTMEMA
jgi:hypothetical protein